LENSDYFLRKNKWRKNKWRKNKMTQHEIEKPYDLLQPIFINEDGRGFTHDQEVMDASNVLRDELFPRVYGLTFEEV
jgi:hypothetical protein